MIDIDSYQIYGSPSYQLIYIRTLIYIDVKAFHEYIEADYNNVATPCACQERAFRLSFMC